MRDEWSNLLRLVNIMNLSMFSRSHVRSIEKANTMSKKFKKDRRRACGSETEASMFDFKKPTERKTNLIFRFGCFQCPGESAAGFEFCSREHMESCAWQRSKPSNEI